MNRLNLFSLFIIFFLSCAFMDIGALCVNTEIVPISIQEDVLEDWIVIKFLFSIEKEQRGVLLIPRTSGNNCINYDKIKVNKRETLCLERYFYFVPSRDSIGIRLNGRFDVEVTELEKNFVFLKEEPVFICCNTC